jgi:uncharacterized protein (TIGR02231 family)
MRIYHLFLALVVCLIPCVSLAAAADRILAPATITAVTVYQDRAQVFRTSTVRLKPGSQTIVFEGLPVLLQDDSVRIEARGTARATIIGIEVKRSFLTQTADKRVNEIDAELKQLERTSDGLDARKSGLIAQKTFIDSIKMAWGERISHQLSVGKPTSAELNEAMGFIGTNTVQTEDLLRKIEQEKLLLKDQIDALKRKRQEAASSGRKESKTIEVAVETAREGALTLDFSAVISQATWEPGYDVRLSPDGTTAELTYHAQVRQHTGEDWNNVQLTLSTARPSSGGAPPALYPWRVSFYRPSPAAIAAAAPRAESRMFKKTAKRLMTENMADMAMAGEEPAPAAFQTAQATAEGTSVVFTISRPVDIPSDNTRHSTVIALEKLPVSTEYITVPKLAPTAYLTAELVNNAAWPLLAGVVKIFSGSTFIGNATLKQVASGEKFTLPFGNDDRIVVRREELKQHKEAGMFGKNRMGYRSTVTVSNFRKEARSISVMDQLPLAGDNEIKVSLEEPTLQPTERKEDGTLLWKLKLAPGETKEFRYEIVVEYPKDREVTGL